MAAVILRLFDNLNQASQSLTKSDTTQLFKSECHERDAFCTLLSRSSSVVLRESAPKDALQLLTSIDLGVLNNIPDLPITVRSLLCLEATNRTNYDEAIAYLPKAIEQSTN